MDQIQQSNLNQNELELQKIQKLSKYPILNDKQNYFDFKEIQQLPSKIRIFSLLKSIIQCEAKRIMPYYENIEDMKIKFQDVNKEIMEYLEFQILDKMRVQEDVQNKVMNKKQQKYVYELQKQQFLKNKINQKKADITEESKYLKQFSQKEIIQQMSEYIKKQEQKKSVLELTEKELKQIDFIHQNQLKALQNQNEEYYNKIQTLNELIRQLHEDKNKWMQQWQKKQYRGSLLVFNGKMLYHHNQKIPIIIKND